MLSEEINKEVYKMEKHVKSILASTILIILIGIFLTSFTSAAEQDNVKYFSKSEGQKYGEITIRNWFIGPKLAEITLTNNSDVCLNDCFAEGKTILYSDASLFEGLSFYDQSRKNRDEITYKTYLITYENITQIVPQYEKSCSLDSKNNSLICSNVNTHNTTITQSQRRDTEYKGEVLSSGEYSWRIEVRKPLDLTLDWIGKSFGQELSEWAWWNNSIPYSRTLNFTTRDAINTNYTHRVQLPYQSEFGASCNQVALVWNNSWERDMDVRICNSSLMEIGFRNNVSMGASIFDNNYSIYYGVSITRKQDRNLIYVWNDDFTGTTVNYSKYGIVSAVNCSTVSSGVCTLGSAGAGTGSNMKSNLNFSNNFTFEMNMSFEGTGGAPQQRFFAFLPASGTGIPDGGTPHLTIGGNEVTGLQRNGEQATSFSNTGYHQFTLFKNSTISAQGYQDNSSAFSPYSLTISWTDTTALPVGEQLSSSGGQLIDYWRVMGDISARPSYLIGSQVETPNLNIAGLVVNLTTPPSGFNSANTSLTLIASVSLNSGNISNATIYVWNASNFLYNKSTQVIIGLNNVTQQNITGLVNGVYLWNVLACATNSTSTLCVFQTSNFTFNIGTDLNSNSFNTTTYETTQESFQSNITLSSGINLSSVNLYWNNTLYPASSSASTGNIRVNSSLTIPTGIYGNVSWFWSLNYNVNQQTNLTTQYQNVSQINLTLCNAVNNIKYINFTFIDEVDNTYQNATIDSSTFYYYLGNGTVNKTLSFSNNTVNPSYGFCFTPASRTLNLNIPSLKYSGSGYPQRTYTLSPTAFNNITTNYTLYMLSSSDGIYSSIAVVQGLGTTPIVGATIIVEQFIGSSWVLISTATTDSAGLATFWLNPNTNYRYTVSATGFVSEQFNLNPSQTIYTVRLEPTTGTVSAPYNSSLAGYKWYVTPQVGTIQPERNRFNLTLTAYPANLYACRWSLINSSNFVTLNQTTGGNSTGCNLTLTYTPVNNQLIFGKLEINNTLTNGAWQIVDTDWGWVTIDIEQNNTLGIINFFNTLAGSQPDFGDGAVRQQFSKMMFFFLIMTILISAFSYFSGFELQNPGVILFVLWFIILIASIAGFFTFTSASQNLDSSITSGFPSPRVFIEQYGIFLIYTFVAGGFMLNKLRKEGQ